MPDGPIQVLNEKGGRGTCPQATSQPAAATARFAMTVTRLAR